ncbi:imidazole glycerol phosphate synthase subunit HisH [Magnetovibrio sp. PR-2]|uniref:imidazole glycerol phosphate synthase subunit HisH n=1 Tax=Magnetovibrio sp. PR-2 TaxID=3120356 RepID=UPI002FCE5616
MTMENSSDQLIVGIIDYGMSNIGSVENALKFLGVQSTRITAPQDFEQANAYILPGVGAFKEAMHHLQESKMIANMEEHILDRKKPMLGICLGLQLLAKSSTEKGASEGLGWIDAEVTAIREVTNMRTPHVGWATLNATDNVLFERLADEPSFYFDHSYHMVCEPSVVIATCDYGTPMTAAIQSGNIFATQFHPEKSQKNGLRLLRGFTNYCAETLEKPNSDD